MKNDTVFHSSNSFQIADFFEGLIDKYPLWSLMAWIDIKQRYRRSLLGPLWITLSMVILTITLGLIWGGLFHQNMTDYLPYLTAGLIAWNFISTTLYESCNGFIDGAGYLKQIKLPLSVFVMRVIWRNLLVYLHTLLIPVAIAFYFHQALNPVILLIIPGLLLVVVNAIWAATLLAFLAARFRDMPPIINSLLQPAFYLTPVIWRVSQLPNHLRYLIEFNPFYYFIEIIREPFFGIVPSSTIWMVVLGITVVGWALALFIYKKLSRRVTYWL